MNWVFPKYRVLRGTVGLGVSGAVIKICKYIKACLIAALARRNGTCHDPDWKSHECRYSPWPQNCPPPNLTSGLSTDVLDRFLLGLGESVNGMGPSLDLRSVYALSAPGVQTTSQAHLTCDSCDKGLGMRRSLETCSCSRPGNLLEACVGTSSAAGHVCRGARSPYHELVLGCLLAHL